MLEISNGILNARFLLPLSHGFEETSFKGIRTIPRPTIPRRTIPRPKIPRQTIPRPDNSPTGHFPDRTFPRPDNSPTGYLPDRTTPRQTIPRTDDSPNGKFPERKIPRSMKKWQEKSNVFAHATSEVSKEALIIASRGIYCAYLTLPTLCSRHAELMAHSNGF